MSDERTSYDQPTEGDRLADAVHFMDSAGWTVVFDDDLKQYIVYDECGDRSGIKDRPALVVALEEVYMLLLEISRGD